MNKVRRTADAKDLDFRGRTESYPHNDTEISLKLFFKGVSGEYCEGKTAVRLFFYVFKAHILFGKT